MAKMRMDLDVHTELTREGVEVTLMMSGDDEGITTTVTYDDLFDDIKDVYLTDHPEDMREIQAIAKGMADMSKDLFCLLPAADIDEVQEDA
ncbi:MAG: hypothetical protein CML81_00605 [Rhodobiaceae bacterium]|nr:hypothetical protein [Rhodobiaceae bacterium]RPF97877.1 MAG: hypothetical protein CBD87_000600 [Rhizobiales bacterium TMED227]